MTSMTTPPALPNIPPATPTPLPFGSNMVQPRMPPPPPPPYQLLGHEHLFNYFRLTKWSKSHLKAPLSSYYDSMLRDANLPLLAGPVQVDGQPIDHDPNSSLQAYAFQQLQPQPLQPRELSAKIRANVLSFSATTSRTNTDAGALRLSGPLSALLDSRALMLSQEERLQRKERKRRKKEEQARLEADAAAAAATLAAQQAQLSTSTAGGALTSSTGENRLTLSLGGIGKKRKADEVGGSGEVGEEKKKVCGKRGRRRKG